MSSLETSFTDESITDESTTTDESSLSDSELRDNVYGSFKSSTLNLHDSLQGVYNECKLLIAAVVQNDVTFMKDYLNFPGWYQVINEEDGNSLLHIAILHQNREVFDYLLSVEDFPLEHVNDRGETALALSLKRNVGDFCDYAGYELIRKGASMQSIILEHGETLLLFVVRRSFVETSKYLMEIGFDVNVVNDSGLSPLWYSFENLEIMMALFSYGAVPSIEPVYNCYNMFEFTVKYGPLFLREIFYHYMFDEYTVMDIHFEVLLLLAEENFPFFDDVIKHTGRVIIVNRSSFQYYYLIFVIDVRYLKKLIEKCPDAIREVFANVTPYDHVSPGMSSNMSLDSVNALIESDLKWDTINFIIDFSERYYFYWLVGYSGSVGFERVCYLLSYGLILDESHLASYYEWCGYGEFVKVLLHMDLKEKKNRCLQFTEVFLIFIYDITLDLDTYLENPKKYSLVRVGDLLHYFVNKKLKNLCYDKDQSRTITINQPQVPLLVEMARNVFRKHFIQTFGIKTAKRFYSLLNGLPISTIHKKIITYQTKLY